MTEYCDDADKKRFEELAAAALRLAEAVDAFDYKVLESGIRDSEKITVLKITEASRFRQLAYLLTAQAEWTGDSEVRSSGVTMYVGNWKYRRPKL